MRQLQELHDRIDREIHAVTGVRMSVELVAPNTLERSAGQGAARARPPAQRALADGRALRRCGET